VLLTLISGLENETIGASSRRIPAFDRSVISDSFAYPRFTQGNSSQFREFLRLTASWTVQFPEKANEVQNAHTLLLCRLTEFNLSMPKAADFIYNERSQTFAEEVKKQQTRLINSRLVNRGSSRT
jgi:hypothetical protein